LSIFIIKNGKKTLPASVFIKLIIFCCLIALSAVLLQPLQTALNNAIYQIHTVLIESLKNLTGLNAFYSSIRPAFWGSFDIRDLKFINNDDPFFTVSRVRLSFSLRELIFNRNLIIHTVQIDKPEIDIDIQRDRETLDTLSALFSSNADIRELLANFFPEDTVYRINNGNFFLADNNSIWRIEGINVNFQREITLIPGAEIKEKSDFLFEGYFSFFLKFSEIFSDSVIASLVSSGGNFTVKTNIDINGTISSDFTDGNARLSFTTISISQFDETIDNPSFSGMSNNSNNQKMLLTLLPFNTEIFFIENIISLNNPKETASNVPAFHYSAGYNIETGDAYADVDFFGYHITDRIIFSGDLAEIGRYLNLQITGDASLRYSNSSLNSLDYHANLIGTRVPLHISTSFGNNPYPLEAAFVIDASGNEQTAFIYDFMFNSSAISAETSLFYGVAGFSGTVDFSPLLLNGKILFDRFSLTGDDNFSAIFDLTSYVNDVRITSDEISIAQTSINGMKILLSPSERDIGIMLSFLSGETGEVFLDAVYNRNPGQIEATVSFLSVSVYDMTEIIRPFMSLIEFPSFSEDYLKDSNISAELFLSTDFNNIVYNIPVFNFNTLGLDGSISLSGTDRQLTLSEGIVSIGENELFASAVMNFSNTDDLDFSINADYLDFAWRLDGHIMDRNTLILHDPNGLNLYGNLLETGEISGYVESIEFPIPVGSQTVYLSFYNTLRYESYNSWNLDIDHFTAFFNGDDYVSVSGTADQGGVNLKNIIYSDTAGNLSGAADISWVMDFSYIKITAGLKDARDHENYFLEGVYNNGNIKTDFSVSNMQADRFFKKFENMLVSGDLTLVWNSIDSFNAEINVTSFNTFFRNSPLYGSVSVEVDNKIFLLHNLNLKYSGYTAYMPQLQMDLSSGIIKTSVNIKDSGIDNIAANVLLDAYFNKIDSWMDIAQVFEKYHGTLMLRNIEYHEKRYNEMAFIFSGEDGAFSVSGGIRDMLRLEIDSQGLFFAGLSAPFPIQGTVIGTYKDGILDAGSKNIYIDMESLWNLVGGRVQGFSILGGYITGQMDFRGPLFNPEFYGKARATSMRFHVPGFINADIRSIPFDITAEGYEMTFGHVVTSVGSGSGILDGWFQFENWIPSSIGLDINIPRNTPIPFNFGIAGFLANGLASGNMDILIDIFSSLLEISGNLFSNQADLGLNMDALMTSQEEADPVPESSDNNRREMNIVTDFTIATGTMIEFAWPVSSPIIRANPEQGSVVYVTSDSQAKQFSLNGSINIRSGELFYFDRSFYIRQGTLNLRENNQFDPRITARAEIRERAESGAVTISMIVDNQPLRNFEPRFESNPNLTQLELYSILGQNFSANQSGESLELSRFLLTSTTDILTQIISTSDTLSQFVFFRQIERNIRDLLRLDMFSVRSRFFQNAVLSGVTGFVQTPVDRNFTVGNYFDNTTVFMGKYIGTDMFIQLMVAMRYDEHDTKLGGLVIEPDLGIELQSPFVNIRWSFFPYHPENWWVSDNSITLSWRRTY